MNFLIKLKIIEHGKIRKGSDLNFKIAFNLRSRTSKASKSQNSRKKNAKLI